MFTTANKYVLVFASTYTYTRLQIPKVIGPICTETMKWTFAVHVYVNKL